MKVEMLDLIRLARVGLWYVSKGGTKTNIHPTKDDSQAAMWVGYLPSDEELLKLAASAELQKSLKCESAEILPEPTEQEIAEFEAREAAGLLRRQQKA